MIKLFRDLAFYFCVNRKGFKPLQPETLYVFCDPDWTTFSSPKVFNTPPLSTQTIDFIRLVMKARESNIP